MTHVLGLGAKAKRNERLCQTLDIVTCQWNLMNLQKLIENLSGGQLPYVLCRWLLGHPLKRNQQQQQRYDRGEPAVNYK